jgi:hypothetical protein
MQTRAYFLAVLGIRISARSPFCPFKSEKQRFPKFQESFSRECGPVID